MIYIISCCTHFPILFIYGRMLTGRPIIRSKFGALLKCKEEQRRKFKRFAKRPKVNERMEEVELLEKNSTP